VASTSRDGRCRSRSSSPHLADRLRAIHVLPGSAATLILGEYATAESLRALERDMASTAVRPPVRAWMGGVSRAIGYSLAMKQPVTAIVGCACATPLGSRLRARRLALVAIPLGPSRPPARPVASISRSSRAHTSGSRSRVRHGHGAHPVSRGRRFIPFPRRLRADGRRLRPWLSHLCCRPSPSPWSCSPTCSARPVRLVSPPSAYVRRRGSRGRRSVASSLPRLANGLLPA